MEITDINKKSPLVEVGMLDIYEIKDKWYFYLDIDNPWPTLCSERAKFISYRMIVRQFSRQPKIVLFFDVSGSGKEELLYVKDRVYGELKYGNKFFLDHKAMLRPADIIAELLTAHREFIQLWENYREEERRSCDESIARNRESFKLFHGGKSE